MSSVSIPGMSIADGDEDLLEGRARRHRVVEVDDRQQVDERRQLRVDHVLPSPVGSVDLLRLHPDAGVDADRLGVHVRVGQQLDRQRGELGRPTQAVREEHVLGQLALERLGALARAVDRRVDQPRQDAC